MQTPPLDPNFADIAPSGTLLTSNDESTSSCICACSMRMRKVRTGAVVLHLDPEHECDRVRKAFDSHLSRAKWMTEHGYRHLLRGGA